MFQVGDELGRYEIIAHLKSGGMAALYLGRRKQPPDNRIFAIKVVHPHLLDDAQLVQMFLDEARLSARIDHPNVVRVEETGEDRSVHFLSMEYVHGCSLAQLLQALIRRGRRMQPELAVHIAMNIAEGLHAAHETKDHLGEPLHVVHRDVSPQNVLLSHTGDVKLIDFGIAKSRARMHHSMTGVSIRGKLRYMSPEHARGKSVDRRTDVYALGIVLWEMLTMRPLFWAETDFDVLRKVQDPKVDPPSRYAPSIPPELDASIMRALARDRDERPYTAMELRQILSRSLPFAEALDSEQVAELLDAVLGEEIDRATEDIPEEASVQMGIVSGAGASSTRRERFTRPITLRALEELTFEFRDASVSADSFAEDDEEVSGESTIDEGLDEPTELMSKESLQQLQRTFGIAPAGQAGQSRPAQAGTQGQVPPPSARSARANLMDIAQDTEHEREATVVEQNPPTFQMQVPPTDDFDEEQTALNPQPTFGPPAAGAQPRPSAATPAPPRPRAPAQPPPQSAPQPDWLNEDEDSSAERMALFVGAAVAAVLLVLVGVFILL